MKYKKAIANRNSDTSFYTRYCLYFKRRKTPSSLHPSDVLDELAFGDGFFAVNGFYSTVKKMPFVE